MKLYEQKVESSVIVSELMEKYTESIVYDTSLPKAIANKVNGSDLNKIECSMEDMLEYIIEMAIWAVDTYPAYSLRNNDGYFVQAYKNGVTDPLDREVIGPLLREVLNGQEYLVANNVKTIPEGGLVWYFGNGISLD